MIIKRDMAVDSLTKVCEESLKLIKELIEADNAVYGKGFEDGIAAQAKVQHTLKPWVDLTPQDLNDIFSVANTGEGAVRLALEKIKEKNT